MNEDKKKIVLAEDDQEVLALMAKKVAQSGYEVFSAADGEIAWEMIVRHEPDVIVLDLTMPKLDGLGLLKRLRENPSSKKWQPVIIVSGRDEFNDMQQGFALEADHYLTKPCPVEDVLRGIELMLSLVPQRKSLQEINSDGTPAG